MLIQLSPPGRIGSNPCAATSKARPPAGFFHVHVPPTHAWPVGQTTPQAPQLFGSIWVLMHTPMPGQLGNGEQTVNDDPQDGLHAPATHGTIAAHLHPQPLQLFSSVFVSTHVPPQSVGFVAGQAHTPVWQIFPPAHWTPQAPQLALSDKMLTQAGGLPQGSRYGPPQGFMHTPLTQIEAVAGHTVLQFPQCWGSVAVLTLTPSQQVMPAPPPHDPLKQPQLSPHFVPQAPQLSLSLWRSTQEPLQQVNPVGQAQQVPAIQGTPVGHGELHAPQC